MEITHDDTLAGYPADGYPGDEADEMTDAERTAYDEQAELDEIAHP